jgi:hypothetical protein
MISPKFDALAASTRGNYARILRLAERADTLGALPVDVIRPALVQAFLDGLADRPGTQKVAQSVLKTVEKWALRRDLLPYPITTGTEAIGSQGGHNARADRPGRADRRAPHRPRRDAGGKHGEQRPREDALVRY